MEAAEVQARIDRLQDAVWELAAIAIAVRTRPEDDEELRAAAWHVLAQMGLAAPCGDGVEPTGGLAELVGADPVGLASAAGAGILQSAALLSGVDRWTGQDDSALLAQGRAGTTEGAAAFRAFVLPRMDGLAELLGGPSPTMLDVGVGVAGLAVAWCETFPALRVVGIDVFARALELARNVIGEAGLHDRIELRNQDVAELQDRDRFCLAWLPAPFVPRHAIDAGLPRIAAALVPGGWIMLAHGKLSAEGSPGAVTRFRTVAFGGTALDDQEAEALLSDTGLELVATVPTPPGAPGLTVGRRPLPG